MRRTGFEEMLFVATLEYKIYKEKTMPVYGMFSPFKYDTEPNNHTCSTNICWTNNNSNNHNISTGIYCIPTVCGTPLNVYMNDGAREHTCDGKNLGGKERIRMYWIITHFRNNRQVRATAANAQAKGYHVTCLHPVGAKTHGRPHPSVLSSALFNTILPLLDHSFPLLSSKFFTFKWTSIPTLSSLSKFYKKQMS